MKQHQDLMLYLRTADAILDEYSRVYDNDSNYITNTIKLTHNYEDISNDARVEYRIQMNENCVYAIYSGKVEKQLNIEEIVMAEQDSCVYLKIQTKEYNAIPEFKLTGAKVLNLYKKKRFVWKIVS
jgi:hypothetical protein